jgi:pyridinium-3,5-bisthiocarboxylic acid mononucleotide nickel chelatase
MLAYLDCFSGISGDMLLGALIDLGWSLENLQAVVDRLQLDGVTVDAQRVEKQGISATWIHVNIPDEQVHRHRSDLIEIITRAKLSDDLEERAIAVVDALALAESKVHNVSIEEIHFHEIGAVDTIVDIVGAVVGLHELGISELVCSPLPWSYGTVRAAHGILPVPPPAVTELLQGIPVVSVDVQGELVTPTGAALARVLSKSFGSIPSMTIGGVGYGAGTKNLPERANVLRIVTGHSTRSSEQIKVETLTILACNIDDANPEWLGILPETMLQAGALDVWMTPTFMKKNRPATCVEVLCRPENTHKLRDLLFRHTTTLGIREQTILRSALPRYFETVETPFGSVQVKFTTLPDGSKKFAPEHEDCATRAREHNVSVREVWLSAIQAIEE